MRWPSSIPWLASIALLVKFPGEDAFASAPAGWRAASVGRVVEGAMSMVYYAQPTVWSPRVEVEVIAAVARALEAVTGTKAWGCDGERQSAI